MVPVSMTRCLGSKPRDFWQIARDAVTARGGVLNGGGLGVAGGVGSMTSRGLLWRGRPFVPNKEISRINKWNE
jgi:hypothetical protein